MRTNREQRDFWRLSETTSAPLRDLLDDLADLEAQVAAFLAVDPAPRGVDKCIGCLVWMLPGQERIHEPECPWGTKTPSSDGR